MAVGDVEGSGPVDWVIDRLNLAGGFQKNSLVLDSLDFGYCIGNLLVSDCLASVLKELDFNTKNK